MKLMSSKRSITRSHAPASQCQCQENADHYSLFATIHQQHRYAYLEIVTGSQQSCHTIRSKHRIPSPLLSLHALHPASPSSLLPPRNSAPTLSSTH